MTEAKTLLDRYLLAWIEPHPARRTWCSTTLGRACGAVWVPGWLVFMITSGPARAATIAERPRD